MSSTTTLTPLYSLPCSLHRQIVLIARDPHGKRKKYLFTGNAFTETDCECCPVLEGLDDLQICGTRGFGFQTSHWDYEGNQLICVGIEWDRQLRNTKARSGSLRYFVNSKGQLDSYEWSLIDKCFKATGELQIQLETSEAQANETRRLLDFLLVPVDLKDCQPHGIVMNAKNHIGITQQYRWNRYRDQLELIGCSCQRESLNPSDDGHFELLREQPDGVRVTIDEFGEIMKTIVRPYGDYQKVMDSTWIRDLKAKSPEELAIIETSDQKLADCFEKEQVDDECWLIFPKERSGYSNDFLVEHCGRVFERLSDSLEVADWQMALEEKDPDVRKINVANLLHNQFSGLFFKGMPDTARGAIGKPRDSSEPPAQGSSDSDQLSAFNFRGSVEVKVGRRLPGRPRKPVSMGMPVPPAQEHSSKGWVTVAQYKRPIGRPRRAPAEESSSGTWSNPLPLNEGAMKWFYSDPFAKKGKDNEQEMPKESPPSTEEFDEVAWEQKMKLVELVMAEVSKNISSDEKKKQIEKRIRLAVVLNATPVLPVTLTSEEREMIEKTLKDCRIALEFEEFQKKLVGEKKEEQKASGAAQDFDWNDYELKSDDEGTVKGGDSDSEESDMDYDDSEDVKQMAPESVITRDDDDGCSVITDITDYSLLEEKE